MSKSTILVPRITEKNYTLSQGRVYVVAIARDVNKHEVARAVEAQFDVKVTKVNVANAKGKAKRTISIMGKRMRNSTGTRNATRKAYVTLAEGYSLPFFDAVEAEDEKQDALQEKVDKAAAKQAEKAAKPARRGLRRGKADDTKAEEN